MSAESIGQTAFLVVARPRDAKPTHPGAAGGTVDRNWAKPLPTEAGWPICGVEIGGAKRKFRLKLTVLCTCDSRPAYDVDHGLWTFDPSCRLRVNSDSAQRSEVIRMVWGPRHCRHPQMMEQLGFRPPRLQAVVASLVEGGAGLALAAGLLTPLAAAGFISVMFVATVSVHLPKGFFIQQGGFEYTVALAAGALAVAFTGPGAISADAALGIDWSGPS